jgi:diguanylate cyclase (GGDEF)-like protein
MTHLLTTESERNGGEVLFATLRELLRRTAGKTGQPFIDAAAQALADVLAAEFVFITRAVDYPTTHVQMLATRINAQMVEPWQFGLAGTPCEAIYECSERPSFVWGPSVGTVVIHQDVCRLFEPARDTGRESFIGVALWDDSDRMMGHIAVFFQQPLDPQRPLHQHLVEMVQIFALKIEAELQRLDALATATQLRHQLEVANRQLHYEASTDCLTALPNRRAFVACVEQLHEQFQGGGQPWGLVVMDLDRFKSINDRFGHPGGDAVLVAVAQALAEEVQQHHATVFRLGGEEFAVVLHGQVDAERLESTTRLLCDRVRRAAPLVNGEPLPVTASMGAALVRTSDTVWEAVYRRADAQLYVAKQTGRDRVCLDTSLH